MHNSTKLSFKFKLLPFWKKKAPLLTKNAPFENVTKKLGRALPPPSFGQNPKEQQYFSGERPLELFNHGGQWGPHVGSVTLFYHQKTPKCTQPNSIKATRSHLGHPQGSTGPSQANFRF